MSYRQKLNGKWTEWSKSCVEVGDCVIDGTSEQSIIVTDIEDNRLAGAWKDGERYFFMADEIRSRNPHGDPRRHPRFVPNVPQFPATEEGMEMARDWAIYAIGYEVSFSVFGWCKPIDFAYDASGDCIYYYRIRRIGETVDYRLFVEVQNG